MEQVKNKLQLLSVLFAFLVCCQTAFAQNDIMLLRESRQYAGFQKLHCSGKMNVYISQDSAYECIIEADKDIIDDIKTEIQGNILIIYPDHKALRHAPEINIYIRMPIIDQLKLSGSGDFYVDRLEGSQLKVNLMGSGNIFIKEAYVGHMMVDLAGSGNIELYQKSKQTDAKIYGSGNLVIKGYAENADYLIAGSGKLLGKEFQTDYCGIKIMGSGDVYTEVRGNLDVDIFGSGNIYFKGNPEVEMNSIGTGKLYSFE